MCHASLYPPPRPHAAAAGTCFHVGAGAASDQRLRPMESSGRPMAPGHMEPPPSAWVEGAYGADSVDGGCAAGGYGLAGGGYGAAWAGVGEERDDCCAAVGYGTARDGVGTGEFRADVWAVGG
jgi:hypothetical protein